jgi:Ribbon-helix-helix domain
VSIIPRRVAARLYSEDRQQMCCKSTANPPQIHANMFRIIATRSPHSHIYLCADCIFYLTYVDILTDICRMKKRTTVWLPQELVERLKKLSRKTGAPMAELFRRAVEAYLKRQK